MRHLVIDNGEGKTIVIADVVEKVDGGFTKENIDPEYRDIVVKLIET